MTLCAVNAHHQNGVAEQHIQDLTDQAQAMLANACHKKPYVSGSLWPFGLRRASEIDCRVPK
jgi:hypothetical protein